MKTEGTQTIPGPHRRAGLRAAARPQAGPTSAASTPIEGHKIHSARWDHDYDFTGKRVAVIGTGASAVQIVPELVKQAEFVKVFQRTPGWVLPRLDIADARRGAGAVRQSACHPRACPPGAVLGPRGHRDRAGVGHSAHVAGRPARQGAHPAQVKDPWLRRQLTPDFTPGCKRMLISSDYYPALQRDNCKLIDWPIATISPVGIRTSDGIEHHLDCIVFATGYDVHLTGPPYPVTGIGGRSLRRRMGRRRAGVQEHQRPRLPEPVLHDRPQLRARATTRCWSTSRGRSTTRSAASPRSCETTCATSMSAPTCSGATTGASRSGSPRRPGCRAAAAGI